MAVTITDDFGVYLYKKPVSQCFVSVLRDMSIENEKTIFQLSAAFSFTQTSSSLSLPLYSHHSIAFRFNFLVSLSIVGYFIFVVKACDCVRSIFYRSLFSLFTRYAYVFVPILLIVNVKIH